MNITVAFKEMLLEPIWVKARKLPNYIQNEKLNMTLDTRIIIPCAKEDQNSLVGSVVDCPGYAVLTLWP